MARTVEEILRVQLGGLMLDLAVQIAAKEAAEEKLAKQGTPVQHPDASSASINTTE